MDRYRRRYRRRYPRLAEIKKTAQQRLLPVVGGGHGRPLATYRKLLAPRETQMDFSFFNVTFIDIGVLSIGIMGLWHFKRQADKRYRALNEKWEEKYKTLQQASEKRYDTLQQEHSTFQQVADKRYTALSKQYDTLQQEHSTFQQVADKRYTALSKQYDTLQQQYTELELALSKLQGRYEELREMVERLFLAGGRQG